MDMLMSREAVLLLVLFIVAGGLVFVVVRLIGARAVRGDHPREEGYDPERHRHP